MTPSPSLIAGLAQELGRHAPFAQMTPAGVQFFIRSASEVYYAPGERVLGPEGGPVQQLFYVRQGAVTGRRDEADSSPYEYEVGDLFPVGALLGQRPVHATYRATRDLFCLTIPADVAHALSASEPAFADFLARRVQRYLELSRRALQIEASSRTLAEQSLETPLAEIPRKTPLTCRADTPLAEALQVMHARRIGSMLITGDDGRIDGIMTRHDVLQRVALAQTPLDTPVSAVMTKPVLTLDGRHTAEDAVLLMSRHGIRHVPVVDDDGLPINILSERDLFAMQRLSLKQIGSELRQAGDVDTLRHLAPEIGRFARNLLAHGVGARTLTALVSHLNDALTARLVDLTAQSRGLSLSGACWLAFGSEGRGEQTIATDQDNGIVFEAEDPGAQRETWLALGREVNDALDACGYPLCKGGIMAGRPDCCRSLQEWRARFGHWLEHGAPDDLLAASIFFDLRPVAGEPGLARQLRAFITERSRAVPRFARQLAEVALQRRPPLNWRGAIDTDEQGGVDLKMQGTALFVDVARIYALAHGIDATATRDRLEAVGGALQAPRTESESWIGAFEFLQMLRLRAQQGLAHADGSPNRIQPATLSDIDRRMLKESLGIARRLQERLELDYLRG